MLTSWQFKVDTETFQLPLDLKATPCYIKTLSCYATETRIREKFNIRFAIWYNWWTLHDNSKGLILVRKDIFYFTKCQKLGKTSRLYKREVCLFSRVVHTTQGGIWKRKFHSEKAFVFEKTASIGETQDCCDEVVSKMFPAHKNGNADVFKFLLFESVYEKVLFHDGLVWTVGLTVEIKLPFPNSPAYLVCRLKYF